MSDRSRINHANLNACALFKSFTDGSCFSVLNFPCDRVIEMQMLDRIRTILEME